MLNTTYKEHTTTQGIYELIRSINKNVRDTNSKLCIFRRDILFALMIISMIISCVRPVSASEWYENGTLHEATFQQWKTATHSNKLATCAEIILIAAQKGYIITESQGKLLNTNHTELLKTLAEILVITTDAYINNSNHLDEASDAIVLGMLVLQWISPRYIEILRNIAHTTPSLKINEATHIHNPNKTGNSPKSQNVKIRKYRLMSPAKGRKWVKKNITPVIAFPKDEFVERFGDYKKATDSLTNKETLEKYYFKRINMTFFVLQEHQMLIGFCEGKGFLKSQS